MAAVDKLVQSRRAMQMTVLLSAVVFSALLFAIVVAANDWHVPLMIGLIGVFVACVFAIGPRVYAFEARPHNKVRLHRPIGVVDLDLSTVEIARRRTGVVVKANGHAYPLIKGVGSPSLIDEWLRRAAR